MWYLNEDIACNFRGFKKILKLKIFSDELQPRPVDVEFVLKKIAFVQNSIRYLRFCSAVRRLQIYTRQHEDLELPSKSDAFFFKSKEIRKSH